MLWSSVCLVCRRRLTSEWRGSFTVNETVVRPQAYANCLITWSAAYHVQLLPERSAARTDSDSLLLPYAVQLCVRGSKLWPYEHCAPGSSPLAAKSAISALGWSGSVSVVACGPCVALGPGEQHERYRRLAWIIGRSKVSAMSLALYFDGMNERQRTMIKEIQMTCDHIITFSHFVPRLLSL